MLKTTLQWHSVYEEMPKPKTNGVGLEFVNVFTICEDTARVMPSVYSRAGFNTFYDTTERKAYDEGKWNDVAYWAYMPTPKEILHGLE